MSRDFWTIYDDDSMGFDTELELEEHHLDMGMDTVMEQVIKRLKLQRPPEKVDHFEQESDLFEV